MQNNLGYVMSHRKWNHVRYTSNLHRVPKRVEYFGTQSQCYFNGSQVSILFDNFVPLPRPNIDKKRSYHIIFQITFN